MRCIKSVDMEELSHRVVEVAKKLAENELYRVYLYGSYARGDFDEESDIDIIIIVDCAKEQVESYRKRMCHYAGLIGMEFDREVSLIMRDKETFDNNQETSPFFKNIIREGVVLYG